MMKQMMVLLLALLLAAPAAADIQADTQADSKEERIRELMSLMQMDTQFDQMQLNMQAMISDLAPTQDWSDQKRAIMDRYRDQMLALTLEELGWDRLEPMMVDLYAAYFTEQEIMDMIAFHRSPTGQRMIETMPMIMEESMLFGQEAMVRMMPRMQALSEEMNAELAQYRRDARSQTAEIAQ